MSRMRTVAQVSAQSPHLSMLRRRLAALAGTSDLHGWLIDEANRRGFFGAFNRVKAEGPPTPGLSHEELVVALLMPQAEADARTWKLVVRMLQSERLDASLLATLARHERAEVMLHWLLRQLPSSERTGGIEAVAAALRPPRGMPTVTVVWDPSRLVKRVATGEKLWRPKQS